MGHTHIIWIWTISIFWSLVHRQCHGRNIRLGYLWECCIPETSTWLETMLRFLSCTPRIPDDFSSLYPIRGCFKYSGELPDPSRQHNKHPVSTGPDIFNCVGRSLHICNWNTVHVCTGNYSQNLLSTLICFVSENVEWINSAMLSQ